MNKIQGNIVDVVKREIYPGEITILGGKIKSVKRSNGVARKDFILPGLIDSHIHIESSMLTPARFSEIAVRYGTIAAVSDPHEIANVLGVEGIKYMMRNASTVPFRFYFGAPSCVPATDFETSGARIGAEEVLGLLKKREVKYLSEMMNYPGVINGNPEVLQKIAHARELGKPVDGHAPGLRGNQLDLYLEAGVKTDHECFSLEEAEEKIQKGMLIQIREGSAARNFESLSPLIDKYPEKVMLCSDDLHPDQLIKGHINKLISRGLGKGIDIFNLLRAATVNPKSFYNLDTGILQEGDWADFIIIGALKEFDVREVYIKGNLTYNEEGVKFRSKADERPNKFFTNSVTEADIRVKDKNNAIKIIEAIDGDLVTGSLIDKPNSQNGFLVSDTNKDVLKIVVQNRYQKEKPSVGFIKNFGLKKGGMVSTIAHDSHNIICIGTSDKIIIDLIKWVNQSKGGIAFSDGEEITGLPLPVAGILTDENPLKVAGKYKELEQKARDAGSRLKAPFMTLSFMSLLVIPELKIGNKGLFNVNEFQFTNLYEG